MVIAYHPQKFGGHIDANTNYPPQRFDESGSIPPPPGGTMLYENSVTMEYEDLVDMDYES